MALALRQAWPLKAEIRLGKAISEFKAKLSDGEKAEFNTKQSSSQSSPPTVQDVRILTAKIDRGHGGRCLSTRFMSVMEAVQQFVSFGDIIIGGSASIIACGVWSVVRLALSILSKSHSYIEQLSEIFVQVGNSTPRLEKIATLYHQSRDLQTEIYEYFIVVVHVCSDMVQLTKMSTLKRLGSSISDKSLAEYKKELQFRGQAIRDEVRLQMASEGQQEAEANARARDTLCLLVQSASDEQKFRTKQRILDFCSQIEYTTAWKQSRRAGTTTLFRDCECYKAWKSDKYCSTLVYTGKLGVGKSVMLANMVDDLQAYGHEKQDMIAFFFLRHDTFETLNARTIIGSVTRQLLTQLIDLELDNRLFKDISELFAMTTSMDDYRRMRKILSLVLSPRKRTFVVIDGIDELSNTEMRIFFERFSDLQSKLSISLCIAARQDSSDAVKSSRKFLQKTVVTKVPPNMEEIKSYIHREIKHRLWSEQLIVQDTYLVSEIEKSLYKGSQGMFLWVSLLIEFLCGIDTDEEIRSALDDLPQDLSETYSRILRKSNKPGRPYQRLILEIVSVAQRQLTVEEIQEALSVTPGKTNWKSSRLINDFYATLKCCGGLVTVDEETLAIHFVHHSVKHYLTGCFSSPESCFIQLSDAHCRMSDIIITYFSYSIFERQVSRQVVPNVRAGPAVSGIIQSTRSNSGWIGGITLDFLQKKEKQEHGVDMNIAKTLAGLRPAVDGSTQGVAFADYATTFWSAHLAISLPLAAEMSLLFNKLCNRNFFDADKAQGKQVLLGKAAEFNQAALMKYLVESMGVDVNCTVDETGRTALCMACLSCHYDIVQYLLNTDGIDPMASDESMRTPLHIAIESSHDDIAKALAAHPGINVSQADAYGVTPLLLAMRMNNVVLFEILLNHQSVNINQADPRDQRTLLQKAVLTDNMVFAKSLMRRPDLKLIPSGYDQCIEVFSWAIQEQSGSLFGALMDHREVDIHLRSLYPKIIEPVIKSNNKSILKKLLSHSRMDDVSHSPFNSPKLEKIIHGDISMLQIFFEHQSVRLYISEYLHIAVKCTLVDVAKFLMAYPTIEIQRCDMAGRTPLYHAIQNGDIPMVEMFLGCPEVGAITQSPMRKSPLGIAIACRNLAVVQMLLEPHVIPLRELAMVIGPALEYAIEHGNRDVVAVLLDHPRVKTRATRLDAEHKFLNLAMKSCDLATADLLLNDIRISNRLRDQRGRTALHMAIEASWKSSDDRMAAIRALTKVPRLANMLDYENTSPLHLAAQMNLADVVKLLVRTSRQRINWQNTEGQTPLHLASSSGGSESIIPLLACAAIPNVENNKHMTPANVANETGNDDAQRLLYNYSASLDSIGEGLLTPLHCAAELGDTHIGKLLLIEHPLLLNRRDGDGRTALHLSVIHKNSEFALLLLSMASVIFDQQDIFNQTPLWYAETNGDKEIQDVIWKLLREARKTM
ncbi:NACHT nucleoside triphosphatase [Penicillium pulvis]|uniref:NACHT nucleoside triphosphatase n=1 Tax=Penicillium pulvis TaxID=1562058 RepID=UPI0025476906|nr:NACHT nucleoside triphosphatase [Penicillium pulvis]KAJ5802840.1 NACHT nucleoside triphosphatase [Penicillium pulvis]